MKLLFLGMTALRTLFNTLDPQSVPEALAFHALYPETEEGQVALTRASQLLTGSPHAAIGVLAPWINRTTTVDLPESSVELIERLGVHFPNRHLAGYRAVSEEEVRALPSEEIDLGRALILSEMAGKEDAPLQARQYSAKLDLMALQIEASLKPGATPEEKIAAMNRFVFEEMRFRFPPQSIYAQEIDRFTFLTSVMDDHLGVCLGVSALYLALAQRLDLPLEIITPPGHIYPRYREGERVINIETTARGIDVPSEEYLSVNTCQLQRRTHKEVVGMIHFNQAAVYLHQKKYTEAVAAYRHALLFMDGDPLVQEFLGFALLFAGEKKEGERCLREALKKGPEHVVARQNWAEDYLDGRADVEGLQSIFEQVDETRASIVDKQAHLKEIVARHPKFRAGLLQLAVTYLQLSRAKEALPYLKACHALGGDDPTVAYYLAVVHGERADYPACWGYLKEAEALTAARHFHPKALRKLRRELILHCPE